MLIGDSKTKSVWVLGPAGSCGGHSGDFNCAAIPIRYRVGVASNRMRKDGEPKMGKEEDALQAMVGAVGGDLMLMQYLYLWLRA